MMPDLRPLAIIAGIPRDDVPASDSVSPWDGSIVGRHGVCTEAHIDEAIAYAVRGFETTRALSSSERYDILRRVAGAIEAQAEEFAHVIAREVGKPLKFARIEVQRAIATFTIASEEAKRIGGEILPLDLNEASRGRTGFVRRFPIGVVAGISPFNFPLNLVAHKLAPAMAAGNAFVLKPASSASLAALALGKAIVDAGYPKEAVNIVPAPGRTAERLATDDRVGVLTFTGSAPVGWALKAKAGRKKVVLELGGNAGVIVDASADLKDAIPRLVSAAFAYSGQVCIKTQRILVHRSVFERFVVDFAAAADAVPVGDPMDPEVVVGPMIDDSNVLRVESWVAEAVAEGAKLHTGRIRSGRVVPPIVLTEAAFTSKVVCEEVFGPVVTVQPFDAFDQAIAEVNRSAFGLQAGVFTNDLRHAWRAYEELQVGGVIVNDASSYRIDHMPYGGVKASGFGREGVRYAIESMTEPRLLALRTS
jgi:glyceraldehyde-3-phosphate dehydrogenase (NADP+)